MSEEEKEAIQYLKDVLELANKLPEGELRLMDAEIEAIKTLINDYKTSIKARFELQRRVEKQAKEIERLKEFIFATGGKDIEDITATKYMQIRQEGYIEGKQYEQSKAEKIIHENYISKDKIREYN